MPIKDFAARRVTRSQTLHLDGRVGDVFGLFDPIGEKKWSESWNPVMIFPASGVSQGAVFVTKDHDGAETTWVITEFDEVKHRIAYTSVTPNLRINQIVIKCESDRSDHTNAHVSYTITALSEKGNQLIESFSEEHYREWIMNWEKAINHYLQHARAWWKD